MTTPDYPDTGLQSKPKSVEESKIQQEHLMRAELAALREQTPTSTEDCGTPDRSPSGVHESGLVASTEARPILGRKGVGEGVEATPKNTNPIEEAKIRQEHLMRAELAALREQTLNRAEPIPRGEVCSACGLDLADSESNVYCPWCLQGAQHFESRVRHIITGLIGPAVTDVESLRNQAFADVLVALGGKDVI